MCWLPWETHTTIAEATVLIGGYVSGYRKSDYYAWAIIPKESHEPIGFIDTSVDNGIDAVKVDYGIGKAWWHRGYTSEALSAVIKSFFEEVGANRIFATHDPRNPNSGAVMRKCGMIYEGTLRQARHRKGEYSDRVQYAILADDYFAEESPLVGRTASVTVSVSDENTAIAMKSGSLPVFATPSMVALMEQAACACLDECGVGTTVGTAMNVEHVAASPVGAEITATATITSVSGRKYEFAVSAHDGIGEVGRGTHTRVAIDADRFMKKAEGRRS